MAGPSVRLQPMLILSVRLSADCASLCLRHRELLRGVHLGEVRSITTFLLLVSKREKQRPGEEQGHVSISFKDHSPRVNSGIFTGI